jgi:hypothetical protein
MFLGLPDPSLLCTDPDPCINKQLNIKKVRKNLDFYYCVIFFSTTGMYDNLSLKTDVNVPSKSYMQ